jgi:hypothetical protein
MNSQCGNRLLLGTLNTYVDISRYSVPTNEEWDCRSRERGSTRLENLQEEYPKKSNGPYPVSAAS